MFNLRFAVLFAFVALATMASSQDAPAPAKDAPAPVQDSPAPSQDAPAPAQDTPTPAQDAAAPAQDSPSPAQDAPAPTQDSPAPASDAPQDASAAPQQADAAPNQKIVRSIDCSSGFTAKGNLRADDRSVQLDDFLKTGGDDEVPVVFTECKSDALETKQEGSKHYGLLSPSDKEQKTCLRAEALAKENAHIKPDECSKSDDSSQMVQFWIYDEDKKGLAFLGRAGGGNPYVLNVKDDAVTVSPNGTSDATLTLQ